MPRLTNPLWSPGLEDFINHLTSDPNALDITRLPLYDSITYPAAGTTAPLSFFSVPAGAGTSSSSGNSANPKGAADTNMEIGGALSQPNAFWVEDIEVDFQPGSDEDEYVVLNPITVPLALADIVKGGVADVNAFMSGGVGVFRVNTKVYYQDQPMFRFPTQRGFMLDGFTSALTADETADPNGATRIWQKMRSVGEPAKINPGVAIAAQQGFGFTVTYPQLIPLPSGFVGRVTAYLNGWFIRPVQ